MPEMLVQKWLRHYLTNGNHAIPPAMSAGAYLQQGRNVSTVGHSPCKRFAVPKHSNTYISHSAIDEKKLHIHKLVL